MAVLSYINIDGTLYEIHDVNAYVKPQAGIPESDLHPDVQGILGAVETIDSFLPSEVSEFNKLADKNYVNSSIATATATYRGAYNLVTDLSLTTSATHAEIATALSSVIATADNNDYCYVQVPTADATPTEIASVERYKYNGSAWVFEYALNNSGFTAAQWAAVNSGITSGLVAKLSALPTNSELTTLLSGKTNIVEVSNYLQAGKTMPVNASVYVYHAAPVRTFVQAISSTGIEEYDFYLYVSIYARQGSDKSAAIAKFRYGVGDDGWAFVELALPSDANYATYAALLGENTATTTLDGKMSATDKQKLDSLATVATSGSYNDLSDKPTIPTVPTNVSAFMNDAGYLTQHQSLANYYTKTEVNTALNNKQDVLIPGDNITIEGNVISARGGSSGGTAADTSYDNTDSHLVATNVQDAVDEIVAQKGAANGVAELNGSGKVPAAQLPSYVDDIINGYLHEGHFYEEDTYETEIVGAIGYIYYDLATTKQYRWNGIVFVEIINSGGCSASDVVYNNTDSHLAATNVQTAIDELNTKIYDAGNYETVSLTIGSADSTFSPVGQTITVTLEDGSSTDYVLTNSLIISFSVQKGIRYTISGTSTADYRILPVSYKATLQTRLVTMLYIPIATGVFILQRDGNYYLRQEYDAASMKENAVGVLILTSALISAGFGIVLRKDVKYTSKTTANVRNNNSKTALNGISNTEVLYNNNAPNAVWARGLSFSLDSGVSLIGYIGSYAEAVIVNNNKSEISLCMGIINGYGLPSVWGTSTYYTEYGGALYFKSDNTNAGYNTSLDNVPFFYYPLT